MDLIKCITRIRSDRILEAYDTHCSLLWEDLLSRLVLKAVELQSSGDRSIRKIFLTTKELRTAGHARNRQKQMM